MLRRLNPTRPRVHGSDHVNAGEDPIPFALIFIDSKETDSSELTSSTTETTLQTITLPPNSFDKILIEFGYQARFEASVNSRCDYTWRVKVGTTTVKTFYNRIIASATTGIASGNRISGQYSAIYQGGNNSPLTVSITGQMSVSDPSCGMRVHYLRIFGINKSLRP
jgi:hypothetical protein